MGSLTQARAGLPQRVSAPEHCSPGEWGRRKVLEVDVDVRACLSLFQKLLQDQAWHSGCPCSGPCGCVPLLPALAPARGFIRFCEGGLQEGTSVMEDGAHHRSNWGRLFLWSNVTLFSLLSSSPSSSSSCSSSSSTSPSSSPSPSFCSSFLGLHLRHKEVPSLGV